MNLWRLGRADVRGHARAAARSIRGTALPSSPTAPRSGPRRRTNRGSPAARGARAGAGAPARTGRRRRLPLAACSTSDRASTSAGLGGWPGSYSSPRSYASADRIRVDGVCIRYPPGVGARARSRQRSGAGIGFGGRPSHSGRPFLVGIADAAARGDAAELAGARADEGEEREVIVTRRRSLDHRTRDQERVPAVAGSPASTRTLER